MHIVTPLVSVACDRNKYEALLGGEARHCSVTVYMLWMMMARKVFTG
jgi:hypothetical protein